MKINKLSLKEIFTKHYSDILTKSSLKEFIVFVREWELRKDHPLVLNTPYIGVHRIVFTPYDRDMIFDIFQIDENDLNGFIKNSEGYNPSFTTISDPLNLLLVWLVYLGLRSNIKVSNKEKEFFTVISLVTLYYKFFSSRLNQMFKYPAKEEIMRYTIESLNYKFDIIKYETWKNLFYSKAKEIIYDKQNIHYKTFRTFTTSDDVRYIISNIKTKINSTTDSIRNLYYEYYSTSKNIPTHDATIKIDEKKIVRDSSYLYDTVVVGINNQITNHSMFINDSYIKSLINIFTSVNFPMVKKLLMYLSDLAKSQLPDKVNEIEEKKEFLFYKGIYILVTKIILITFEELRKKNVNLTNKLIIFNEVKKIYRGSKVSNVELFNVKKSLETHILNSRITTRYPTISSLSSIVVLYIYLKIFEILK